MTADPTMPSVSSNRGSAPRQDFVTAFPRVPKLAVNNIIGLDKYYRSATLLLRQVGTHMLPRVHLLRELFCCFASHTGLGADAGG